MTGTHRTVMRLLKLPRLLRLIIVLALFALLSVAGLRFAREGTMPHYKDSTAQAASEPAPKATEASLTVAFDLVSIDPTNKTMSGTISVGLTATAKRLLMETVSTTATATPAIPVAACNNYDPDSNLFNCRLNPGEGDKVIHVYLDDYQIPAPGSPAFRYAYVGETVKLADLFQQTNRPDELLQVGNITLPISGHPFKYPRDTYKTDPISLTVQSQDVVLPRIVRYYSTEELSDLAVTVNDAQLPGMADAGVAMNLARPPLAQFFVFFIAILIPLGLVIIAIDFALKLDMSEGFREFLAAFGVVAFTLLLVKPVVVPASITILTAIDWALAAEVFLIVLCPILFFGHWKLGQKVHDANEPPE